MSSKTSSTTPVSLSPQATPSITLFAGENLSGFGDTFHKSMAKLPREIDNKTSSCHISGGNWVVFHHPNFKEPGKKVPLAPGIYKTAKDMGISNNAVSSIRLLS